MPDRIVTAHQASDKQSASPGPAGQRLLELLLIFLVFFILGGAPVPHVNEPHYLSRLKHYWNPTWCAGDLFLESSEAHLVFVWTLGWVTRWLSLPATAWVGRIVCWLLLALAWQRLSWKVVPRPLASVLSAALFVTLTRQGHLAGEWVIGGVEAKCVAYFFVLWGLGYLVENRWNAVWICLGAATAFHVLVGGWSAVVCAGIWLGERLGKQEADRLERKTPARSTPPASSLPLPTGLAIGSALALLGLAPALVLTTGQPTDLVAEANRIHVFERLPHHLAPLTKPPAEVAERFGRYTVLLGGFLTAGWVVRRCGADNAQLWRLRLFAWGAVLLAATGLAIEIALWSHPVAAARLLKYYWFRLGDIAVPLTVAIHLAALVARGIDHRRTWGVWLLAATLAVGCWQLVYAARQHGAYPVGRSDARMRDAAAWVDVCQWVVEHTPPDAMFLTPRRAVSFKWRTGRPEFVTRKDIPQDAPGVVEWFKRMREVNYWYKNGELKIVPSHGHLGTERVKEIATRHAIRYVLTDRRRPLSLPVAYRNHEYVLYVVE